MYKPVIIYILNYFWLTTSEVNPTIFLSGKFLGIF
jgi:hypothetical protein